MNNDWESTFETKVLANCGSFITAVDCCKEWLACGFDNGDIKVWRLRNLWDTQGATSTALSQCSNKPSRVTCLQLIDTGIGTGKGCFLASGYENGQSHVFCNIESISIMRLGRLYDSKILALSFYRDEKALLIWSEDGNYSCLSICQPRLGLQDKWHQAFKYRNPFLTCFSFSEDWSTLAMGYDSRISLGFFDRKSGKLNIQTELNAASVHETRPEITSVSISNTILLASTKTGIILLWKKFGGIWETTPHVLHSDRSLPSQSTGVPPSPPPPVVLELLDGPSVFFWRHGHWRLGLEKPALVTCDTKGDTILRMSHSVECMCVIATSRKRIWGITMTNKESSKSEPTLQNIALNRVVPPLTHTSRQSSGPSTDQSQDRFISFDEFWNLLPNERRIRHQGFRDFTNYLEVKSPSLGEGKFGKVFSTQWKIPVYVNMSGKQLSGVVVKVLLDPDSRKKYKDPIREAVLSDRFKHENIIPFVGVVLYGRERALSLVYRRMKCTLVELIAEEPDKVYQGLGRCLYQIACGLQYLHKEKIVHCDLHTGNIMSDDRLQLRIGDFGLCRILPDERQLTSNRARGNVQFMAPELLNLRRNEHPVYTENCDVFSFSMVAFHATTFSLPWGDRVEDLAVQRDVVLRRKRPKLPEGTWEYTIITSCWAHNAAERLKATQIVKYLEKYKERYGTNESPPTQAASSEVSSSQEYAP